MRASLVSNFLLCVAAVVLIPQALECCHSQGSTLLESLAETRTAAAERSMRTSHHGHHGAVSHAAKSSPERTRVVIQSLIIGNQGGPSPTDGTEAVSSPMGEAVAKSPSVAAVIPGRAASGPKSIRLLERGIELVLAGRSDRPAIPPPQA